MNRLCKGRPLQETRKFDGEKFTILGVGGYCINKGEANRRAEFYRGLDKKVRVVKAGGGLRGYYLYMRAK